jgi:hypothetical protein
MATESGLVASIGFRHVIEDGLSVLQNGNLEPTRRAYVLDDLTALLRGAIKGSDLARQVSLFVRSDDRNAFEIFSLLDRYLGHGYDPDWREKLPSAEKAFTQLKENVEVAPEARSEAIALLTELLSSVKRRNSVGIPEQPEEITIFG